MYTSRSGTGGLNISWCCDTKALRNSATLSTRAPEQNTILKLTSLYKYKTINFTSEYYVCLHTKLIMIVYNRLILARFVDIAIRSNEVYGITLGEMIIFVPCEL